MKFRLTAPDGVASLTTVQFNASGICLYSSFAKDEGHLSVETEPVAENRVEEESIRGQHFPRIDWFKNNVERTVKMALILIPSTSVQTRPACVAIWAIEELYRFPPLATS